MPGPRYKANNSFLEKVLRQASVTFSRKLKKKKLIFTFVSSYINKRKNIAGILFPAIFLFVMIYFLRILSSRSFTNFLTSLLVSLFSHLSTILLSNLSIIMLLSSVSPMCFSSIIAPPS